MWRSMARCSAQRSVARRPTIRRRRHSLPQDPHLGRVRQLASRPHRRRRRKHRAPLRLRPRRRHAHPSNGDHLLPLPSRGVGPQGHRARRPRDPAVPRRLPQVTDTGSNTHRRGPLALPESVAQRKYFHSCGGLKGRACPRILLPRRGTIEWVAVMGDLGSSEKQRPSRGACAVGTKPAPALDRSFHVDSGESFAGRAKLPKASRGTL
jgi:hypothetical protein